MRLLLLLAILLACLTPEGRVSGATGGAQQIAPAHGITLAAFGAALQWQPAAGATQQHLQVAPQSLDGPGIETLLDASVTAFEVPAPPGWYGLLPDMTYVWRVRSATAPTALDASSPLWGPWAERTFRTPKASPSAVQPSAPASGTAVASLRPHIQWSAPPTLFYFEVQLSTDPTFNTDPATATAAVYSALVHGGVAVPANSYQPPASAPLQPNTQYHWRVRPRVQGDGAPMAWSPASTFTTAEPTPEQPGWLQRLNQHRAGAGIPPAKETPAWTAGCRSHAVYMVNTRTLGHTQDPTSPWASAEGAACAAVANVLAGDGGAPLTAPTDAAVIDGWMTAPFHGLALIDPRLAETAYGRHDEQDAAGFRWAAALDVLRGLTRTSAGLFPVAWPGTQAPTSLTRMSADYPDPLTTCPGYGPTAGLALFLMLGPGDPTPQVRSTQLSTGGQPLDHCVTTGGTYTNPDAGAQRLARSILAARGTVMVIPRQPLHPDRRYAVQVVVGEATHAWEFSTSP